MRSHQLRKICVALLENEKNGSQHFEIPKPKENYFNNKTLKFQNCLFQSQFAFRIGYVHINWENYEKNGSQHFEIPKPKENYFNNKKSKWSWIPDFEFTFLDVSTEGITSRCASGEWKKRIAIILEFQTFSSFKKINRGQIPKYWIHALSIDGSAFRSVFRKKYFRDAEILEFRLWEIFIDSRKDPNWHQIPKQSALICINWGDVSPTPTCAKPTRASDPHSY